MFTLVHELLSKKAKETPNAIALQSSKVDLTYQQLEQTTNHIAATLQTLELIKGERIGIYLTKRCEHVQSMLACSKMGAIFVPINPVLKAAQVQHIVQDSQLKCLITNYARYKSIQPLLSSLPSINHIIIVDTLAGDHSECADENPTAYKLISWQSLLANACVDNALTNINKTKTDDVAAILYTSGSTGKPKGIMLSHHNVIIGAQSVSQYLEMKHTDKVLAILPFSFDYGLNQLTSSFFVGATCVLLDYLLPNDVISAISRYKITGLAAVPPLWSQLCTANWSEAGTSIRYFTNSGGVLAQTKLQKLRHLMPNAKPYLMYGLTEAFRSTYLPPSEIDNKVGSIGKAIPNAEVLILRDDGSQCEVDEVGELVHLGPLVSMGYWQNKQQTALRFKPLEKPIKTFYPNDIAVFSGDYVKRDSDGFIYFINRKDEQIKTSGYRVSPTEIEECLSQLEQLNEISAVGLPHPVLGEAIVVFISAKQVSTSHPLSDKIEKQVIKHCQTNLANYMLPKQVIMLTHLPQNANGKTDRVFLKNAYRNLFQPTLRLETPNEH